MIVSVSSVTGTKLALAFLPDNKFKFFCGSQQLLKIENLNKTMAKKRDLSQRPAFEEQGETYVRYQHTRDGADPETRAQAIAWLAEKQIEREEAATSKRDAREEETLAIARKARSDARLANRIAILATVIAAISIIVNAIVNVMKTP